MGSQSDWPTMGEAATLLEQLQIPFESKIVSAHRTPKRLYEYAETAESRGLQVIIAGAGGAAHLPGMTASLTALPVLGVPVQSKALSGQDSLLSIVQMPAGIPVMTLAIGGRAKTPPFPPLRFSPLKTPNSANASKLSAKPKLNRPRKRYPKA